VELEKKTFFLKRRVISFLVKLMIFRIWNIPVSVLKGCVCEEEYETQTNNRQQQSANLWVALSRFLF